MALRAWASLARLDKLKLIPRGACFSYALACLPGESPASPCGSPKAMKLDLRCSSTERFQLEVQSAELWTHNAGGDYRYGDIEYGRSAGRLAQAVSGLSLIVKRSSPPRRISSCRTKLRVSG